MKCKFRTNIESAILSVPGCKKIVSEGTVFLDRNKCSDRIKFGFTTATSNQLAKIKLNVENLYPGKTVNVYNNTGERGYGYGCYYGVAVSVSHDPGKSL